MRLGGFAKSVMFRRQKDKVVKPPKGFDILLANAIVELGLTEEQTNQLAEMTAQCSIANAIIGHHVWYRRATLERLFPRTWQGDPVSDIEGAVHGEQA